ncbi:hypothetical protein LZ575_03350 [Antarcticibacterium sp. 1MA-6-2]|uniref:hypothetical protein n=1 Tax=Antarcticibacterium sp. 1MA-6-2 TaxID=2908210 RepID=UPI001F290397|nr:hypothetical protein [Antarcticibacterium sp. 1MA-6-2]UJH91732.1 hypothetical protein LZ575_03350 [Antarcticibacterium sp. 1MA-6-2]
MKSNSDFFVNPVSASSYILEGCLQNDRINKGLNNNNFSSESDPKKWDLNFLNSFWKKLTSSPENFPQTPNSKISNILEENTRELTSKATKRVLANKLELSIDSIHLAKAINDSFEIYHEDYPYDFILEYKGERLGMMLLDKCFNSYGEVKLVYRFNPDVKSFQGLH